jgi:hypothetical protein
MTAYTPGINETDLKLIITSLQQLAAGRSNATGTVTLNTGSATTVVVPTQSGMIAVTSQPIFTPMTAAASAELSSGNMFVSSVGKDTFTITHTNSATANRTFSWAIQG